MSQARVLAVDDQRYFRELIEGLLAEEGYAVQTAASGEEALHVLEREDFDVVVTDLVMPGIDGTQLVERLRERRPDQDIVMVTGVADVKTAVTAMKLGVTDYILKPFDRDVLVRSLKVILERRRLRVEHARLMEENLEYLSVLSLYERAASLFSTLGVEALCERVVEGLCLETRAQGGVLWIAPESGERRLQLLAARGIIRVEEEPEMLDLDAFDQELRPLASELRSVVSTHQRGNVLWVALRQAGELLGIARLSDKLDDGDFGDSERAAGEKFASLATVALSNATRFRSLERLTLRDPTTKAYTNAYLQDIVRNEIQKASRFGRTFSLGQIEIQGIGPLRRHTSASQLARWLEEVAHEVGRGLRSTDLLAAHGEGCFRVLLPETDAIGAAVLTQRIREHVVASEAYRSVEAELRPDLVAATVSYPADGTQLETLAELLSQRAAAHVGSLANEVGLEDGALDGVIDGLLARGRDEAPSLADQVTRLVVDEVGRRPGDRGLLFVRPGPGRTDAVLGSLRRLARWTKKAPTSEIILIGEGDDAERSALAKLPVTWVCPERLPTTASLVLYYGDGPAYAAVSENCEGAPNGAKLRFFDTADRPLIEQLAFRLQRELGVTALGAA